MPHRNPRPLASLIVAMAAVLSVGAAPAPDALVRFGVEMAGKGNWREARFRWEQAEKADPGNARILNNLAVAAEALGEPDKARGYYEQALASAEPDGRIRENAVRADRLWTSIKSDASKSGTPASAEVPRRDDGPRKHRDTVEVSVSVPVPARLDITGSKTLLVASFLVNDSDLIDVNREIVRFLRAEFRKHTPLQILDVTPAPAVPEQTLEDMAANAAFWSRMGKEYGADLIVSGMLRYTRADASGFEDVDVVSERTGQKVKETRFVEQERFTFELDVLFLDGASGALRHRDRFRREAVYRGLSNDPITAFYDISGTIAGDVLSVVSQRARQDTRVLFRE